MDWLLGMAFKDRRIHPTRREVVARLLVSTLTIATALLAIAAPGTYTHLMVQIGGVVAQVFAGVLGAVGVTLFVDTFANEIWPSRRRMPRLTSVRQYLWLATGLMHMLFSFLVLTSALSLSLGVFLVIFALGCFALAFVDAAQEKTDTQCST